MSPGDRRQETADAVIQLVVELQSGQTPEWSNSKVVKRSPCIPPPRGGGTTPDSWKGSPKVNSLCRAALFKSQVRHQRLCQHDPARFALWRGTWGSERGKNAAVRSCFFARKGRGSTSIQIDPHQVLGSQTGYESGYGYCLPPYGTDYPRALTHYPCPALYQGPVYDSCITQLEDQGSSRACNESKS